MKKLFLLIFIISVGLSESISDKTKNMKKAKEILKKLSLRPTSQRVAITDILLKKKEVHVTAYSLEKMLIKNKVYIF